MIRIHAKLRRPIAEAEAIFLLSPLHDHRILILMHAWPGIGLKVELCICLWGTRAQQTCGNRLIVRPLGFCGLCIRVHLRQMAAVKQTLPCHAVRPYESTTAERECDRLARAIPSASCQDCRWQVVVTQAVHVAQSTSADCHRHNVMSVLVRMKGYACSTSMASRRRLCLITCTSVCGIALASLLDCHDLCTLSSPQQLQGMALLRLEQCYCKF